MDDDKKYSKHSHLFPWYLKLRGLKKNYLSEKKIMFIFKKTLIKKLDICIGREKKN